MELSRGRGRVLLARCDPGKQQLTTTIFLHSVTAFSFPCPQSLPSSPYPLFLQVHQVPPATPLNETAAEQGEVIACMLNALLNLMALRGNSELTTESPRAKYWGLVAVLFLYFVTWVQIFGSCTADG